MNQTSAKRFRTSSTLHLQPRAEDDYKEYSCEARHKALPPDVPMRAQVQLSVLCKSSAAHSPVCSQEIIPKKPLENN